MKIMVQRTTETEMRKLELKRNDILLMKRPKHMRDKKWSELLTAFADDLVNFIGFNTMVIGVDRTWNEIAKLTPEQMAPYGWVPRSNVLLTKDDSKEKALQVFELLEIDTLLAKLNKEEEE